MPIPGDHLREALFEALRRDFGGQWLGLTQAVAWVATERGWYAARVDTRIVQIDTVDEPQLRRLVEELIEQGLLRTGTTGGGQPGWPWLSLTSYGRAVVSEVTQSG